MTRIHLLELGHRAVRAWMLLSLLAAASGCKLADRPATNATPLRLMERAPGQSVSVTIDGMTRRSLAPARRRQQISLDPVPPRPTLRFFSGLQEGDRPVTVRFRAILRLRDGSLRRIYDRDVETPGWYEERIPLGNFDLAGAVLILRRSVVGELSRREVTRGVWGEPMLLPGDPAERPSVVLVSIDTLRADRVGAYGSSAGVIPALDELAKSGVLYENAYSPSTWTLPSHFSMLRGVPAYYAPQRRRDVTEDDGADTTTIASAFRDAGYLTAAFTGGGNISYRWGFAEGFDSYYSYQSPKPSAEGCSPKRFDGPEVLQLTGQWLDENRSHPFFLFVHTYEAHDRCPLRRRARGQRRWDGSPQGQKRMSEHYDEMIKRADEILAGVLAELASLEQEQRLIIAVTSDHGESLWEHGRFGHGCLGKPYEPLVHVPLIIRPASGSVGGERIATPVSVASIAPTLLALAGLPRPDSMVLPLLPGLSLDDDREAEPIYASCRDQLAVRKGRYKLVSTRNKSRFDEVYDLESDPGEMENLARKDRDLTKQLRELANAYWRQAASRELTRTRGKKPDVDESTRERLEALGYLE